LCLRIESGWTITAAAESMQISRQCAHKWWRRYLAEGSAGLGDRSSRPLTSPNRTPARIERRIVALQRRRLPKSRLGPPLRRAGIRPTRTRPYHSATNGKVERFNRTLLEEWAYARLWTSDARRAPTLDRWLHRYNHHRHHTAIGGPPASRVTNLAVYNN
jgi:Integrase core domain/Helix-turn-helix domain